MMSESGVWSHSERGSQCDCVQVVGVERGTASAARRPAGGDLLGRRPRCFHRCSWR